MNGINRNASAVPGNQGRFGVGRDIEEPGELSIPGRLQRAAIQPTAHILATNPAPHLAGCGFLFGSPLPS
jgi:hypothetical protein